MVVGLGPGGGETLTLKAEKAIRESQAVIGYRTYLNLILPLLEGKQVDASGMTRELDRAGLAIDLALSGRKVSLVSGGDAGVYAMAGVVFDLARSRGIGLGDGPDQLTVEVVAGVPALAGGAAILGAPLTHDFACVSLSDRLTPWELIEKRLDAAAAADFVLVLYNPRSKGRPWQLGRALEIISRHRPPETPVGIARKVGREGENKTLTTLGDAHKAEVDMQSLVFIGNSNSFVYEGFMATPRGYLEKYGPA